MKKRLKSCLKIGIVLTMLIVGEQHLKTNQVFAEDKNLKQNETVLSDASTAMFTYEVSTGFYVPKDTIIIKTYDETKNPNHPHVEIPDEIDGKKVTMINVGVFKNKGLTSVEIPDSMLYIGPSAFYGNLLKSVTIPSQVETIDSYAFYQNTQLTSVNIPESATKIGNDAFRDCSLTSVTLPKGLKHLGGTAFTSNKIESVVIPGSLAQSGGYWGAQTFCNNALKSVVIEEGIKKIPDDFYNFSGFGEGNNHITSLTLPSTLESVGYEAFYNQSLLFIDLPSSVQSVPVYAFANQQIDVDYISLPSSNIVTLPENIDLSKFSLETDQAVFDEAQRTISADKDLTEIYYSYKLGTFNNQDKYLTGSLILNNGTLRVRLFDFDNTLLQEEFISEYDSVIPSVTPSRTGFTFIGWDGSLENITESADIHAVYKAFPQIIAKDKTIVVGDTFDPLKDITALDADNQKITDIKVIKNSVDTTKEGDYTVQLQVYDQWGGQVTKTYTVTVKSQYQLKKLNDKKTGINIEGYFSSNAKVIIEENSTLSASLQEKVMGQTIIGNYEVRIEGDYHGPITLHFPINTKYNGTNVLIYHQLHDGKIETYEESVQSGTLSIKVDELSPFVLTKEIKTPITPETPKIPETPEIETNTPIQNNESASTPSNNVNTSDYTNTAFYAALCLFAGFGSILILKKKNISK